MEFPSTAISFRTPSDSGTNDEFFSIIINDAINTAYVKNKRTQKKFNGLNTNQRTLKKKLSKTNVTDNRIFSKNKLFVPDVGQLKFRFIKRIHDDPAAKHLNKTKTDEIFNRYYHWPKVINDVIKNCYGCRKNKDSRDKYHGILKLLPVPNKRWFSISSLIYQ